MFKFILVAMAINICVCFFLLKSLYNKIEKLSDEINDTQIAIINLKISMKQMEKISIDILQENKKLKENIKSKKNINGIDQTEKNMRFSMFKNMPLC